MGEMTGTCIISQCQSLGTGLASQPALEFCGAGGCGESNFSISWGRGSGWKPVAPLSDNLGLNSRCILKAQPMGFADGLDIEHKRKTRVKNDSRGNGKAKVALN